MCLLVVMAFKVYTHPPCPLGHVEFEVEKKLRAILNSGHIEKLKNNGSSKTFN